MKLNFRTRRNVILKVVESNSKKKNEDDDSQTPQKSGVQGRPGSQYHLFEDDL